MGKGSGYGKVILFGEHFVVHGVPGIVSAIDSSTDATVTKALSGLNVKDERKTAKGYGEEKRLQQIESIERMLKAFLAAIKDGSWAAAFIADQDAGAPDFKAKRAAAEAHPIEETGRKLRGQARGRERGLRSPAGKRP